MTHLIIAGIVLGIAYAALLIVHPVHRCPSCKGRRSVAHGRTRRPCTRCKTTGRTYRRGAIMTHRLIREHAFPRVRNRIHDAIASRLDGDS
jgi:hypothetical protein